MVEPKVSVNDCVHINGGAICKVESVTEESKREDDEVVKGNGEIKRMGENKLNLTEKQKRYLKVKRMADIVLSGGAIVILSPVLVGVSLAIKLESPGPVLFKQKRVGKNKELFEIWKFRSMRIDTPKVVPTHMLSNPEQYITKTGKFLRKTSLDELPQIFNIFRGDRGIIGTTKKNIDFSSVVTT